jgi:hypothetical protein
MKKRLLVLALLAILSPGCFQPTRVATAHRPPLIFNAEANQKIKISGATPAQEKTIREALGFLPPTVQQAVRYIYVRGEGKYAYEDRGIKMDYSLGSIPEKNGGSRISGRCHSDGTIFLLNTSISHELVWHEAAHAFENTLSREKFFDWKKLYNKYASLKSKNNLRFPQKGVLTEYGSTNEYEDFAVWTEKILLSLVFPGVTNPLYNLPDRGNPVYLEKLNYFLEIGMITDYQHKILKPLLK